MKCFIGIDLGTSGIKAVVMQADGEIVGTGYVENGLITPAPLQAEQNPNEWWNHFKLAVRQAVGASGRGQDIVSMAVTGQMLGNVMLDRDGNTLGNCMIWMDQRAVEELEEFQSCVPHQKLLNITGNIALTSLWAPKLIWMKKHQPEIFTKTKHVLFPKDFINYKLTGAIASEVSDASGTALMDVYQRRWSQEIFELCGIPYDIVSSQLAESQDCVGTLRPEIAAELGLNSNVMVAAGSGDQSACGIGSGAVQEGIVSATIGTSGVVFAATNKVVPDTRGAAAMAYCHAIPDLWCIFGCTLGAGGSFRWMRDTLFADESAACVEQGLNPYDMMSDRAARAPLGSEGLIFLPYMNGERTPHPDPHAKGVFWGLSYRHGRDEMLRAVMEGVTFSLRDTVELLRAADIGVDRVHASGGGARSALWRQIQADVFNAELVITNVEETGCVGAAILAGICAGEYENAKAACDAIIHPVDVVEPIRDNACRYDEYYHIYAGLYDSLKHDFAKLSALIARENGN